MTMLRPSGENAACQTMSECPCSLASSLPSSAFHSRAVWSSLAVTIRLPSGENAASQTTAEWPCSLATSWPLAAFHTRAVFALAVMMRLPSGENTASPTLSPSALQLDQQFAVVRVPHPCRTVPAGGDDALTVGRERRLPSRGQLGQQFRECMGHGKVGLSCLCCVPAANR